MNSQTTPCAFDEFLDTYDSLVDWPKRLANEEPFFRRVFREAGVRRVQDAACGTGHHAAMFHRWGLAVEGADLSPAMIARCRQRFGECAGLSWAIRSFDEIDEHAPSFDAIVCIGNSLALVDDSEHLRRVVSALIQRLRPGGVGIFQVLNLWRMSEGPTLWQKCELLPCDSGARIVLKGVHRAGGRGYVDLIDLRTTSSGLVKRFDGPSFLGIESADMTSAIDEAGGKASNLWGSYKGEPYVHRESADLICEFRR